MNVSASIKVAHAISGGGTVTDYATAASALLQQTETATLEAGAGTGQANQMFTREMSVAGLGTLAIDLQTFINDLYEAGELMDALKYLFVKNTGLKAVGTASEAIITVGPGVANGLFGAAQPWGADGDLNSILPGGRLILEAAAAAGYTVDATHKTILITNTHATHDVVVKVVAIGVDAP